MKVFIKSVMIYCIIIHIVYNQIDPNENNHTLQTGDDKTENNKNDNKKKHKKNGKKRAREDIDENMQKPLDKRRKINVKQEIQTKQDDDIFIQTLIKQNKANEKKLIARNKKIIELKQKLRNRKQREKDFILKARDSLNIINKWIETIHSTLDSK